MVQGFSPEDGTSVKDLFYEAGIDEKEIKVAFVNSNVVSLETTFSDGDRVRLVPTVGGM